MGFQRVANALELLRIILPPDEAHEWELFARYQGGNRNDAESDGGREHHHEDDLHTADSGVLDAIGGKTLIGGGSAHVSSSYVPSSCFA